MRLIVAMLALVAFPAFGQTLPTCPANSTVVPQPWNEARVTWVAPTAYTSGQAFPAGTVLTYTVYRRLSATASFVAICTTTALGTALPNQPVGSIAYTATARITTGPESVQPAPFTKVITEPTPNPPTGITVASTRIEPDSWTCRDSSGAVLSRHERQDKAQESCTNFALASVGQLFEMRPSGYRIVASLR